jgi:hypothetical protein
MHETFGLDENEATVVHVVHQVHEARITSECVYRRNGKAMLSVCLRNGPGMKVNLTATATLIKNGMSLGELRGLFEV